ncbi:hypothetical protein LMG33818_001192 [Halomonadaceae bacterium LMG 33818]|uniref:tRNA (N6-threonylcarbamoyladenosine(37)-N6)-methyltransferase TrmO n=1 Tax=Cernens ardua TaxID=3402176 RepID=UPI003EDC4869
MTALTLDPIGYVEGCYPDKFGIPRQPGLAPSATAEIVLAHEYAQADAIRGIEAYSHLWVTFLFHLSPTQWRPLVRPPRLGGNQKVGVFASRSTHRPNRLGQSLVELIGTDTRNGVRLRIRGHDLVNGTPVIDIKPYLPWAESIPDAHSDWAPKPPPRLPVIFSEKAAQQLARDTNALTLKALIVEVLAQDPRPAYHRTSSSTAKTQKKNEAGACKAQPDDSHHQERIYGVRLVDKDIRFRAIMKGTTLTIEVVDIESFSSHEK